MKSFAWIAIFISTGWGFSYTPPDWSKDAYIPRGTHRKNILNLSHTDWIQYINHGSVYVKSYPVENTGLLIPYESFKKSLNNKLKGPLQKKFWKILKPVAGIKDIESFYQWLGLNKKNHQYIGKTLIQRNETLGLTFSCVACHSGNLFGKTIIGLHNRFSRAHHLFSSAIRFRHFLPPKLYQFLTEASEADEAIYKDVKKRLPTIDNTVPPALGLDTSLFQVGSTLHLQRKGKRLSSHEMVGPSKIQVWWNLKYKTKWLADGSIISGNPVITNILWNEIGRGSTQEEIRQWINLNQRVIDELTAYIFSTEPPRITEFFEFKNQHLEEAKKGQILFNRHCQRCHGTYEKYWDDATYENTPITTQIKTKNVLYHEVTPVIDIGTSPNRRKMMKNLLILNELEISKEHNVQVKVQKGYIPPPLVGIWARYPYLHNHSVPSLCEMLSPAKKRRKKFWMVPAISKTKDFDFNCNGIPRKIEKIEKKLSREYLFSTRKKGMSNSGHDRNIFLKNGKSIFTNQDKMHLVRFLQTL